MVQDCLKRRTKVDGIKELAVTTSDVKIDGGACFDVAAYYIGAAGGRNGLKSIVENNVELLEKTHGSHTYMLQHEVLLNGVVLPKGTLMQKGDDGGWAMLRLTPFCFDDQKDIIATGPELAKAELNEQRSIARIGGTALGYLIQRVKKQ